MAWLQGTCALEALYEAAAASGRGGFTDLLPLRSLRLSVSSPNKFGLILELSAPFFRRWPLGGWFEYTSGRFPRGAMQRGEMLKAEKGDRQMSVGV